MNINFDLNDLQAFRAVVEKGSFRKAAEAIRISQPALSRRIDKPDGSFGGLVLGSLKLAYFGRLFDQIGLGNEGAINLYLRDGTRAGLLLLRLTGREQKTEDQQVPGAVRRKVGKPHC